MHRWIGHLGLLAGCASCVSSPCCVRATEVGDHGRVEVAWIELAAPAGRPRVALINMVHVGDPDYFAAVQSRLDGASTVLMEGVVREPTPTGVRPKTTARIGAGLFDLASTFRLAHQIASLRWRSHFRAADMGESEFRDMAGGAPAGSGPSLRDVQRDVNNDVLRFRRQHPLVDANAAEERVRRGVARQRFARQIMRLAVADPRRPVVVQARNMIALRALDRCPEVGEVVLCWGFVHGPDFLRALARRGYRISAITWREVFRY